MLTVDAAGVVDLDLDTLTLTAAQRDALAIDRHVVVSAGAGSGKTHTLAWRYVRLLVAHLAAGGSDIESVVVLTFTEKAAEEMADRCRQRLSTLATWARRANHPLSTALDGVLDQFDRARISTFHSFCARLLRDNPAAMPGGADLQILEPEESAGVRTGVVQSALDRWVTRHDPDLGVLLDTFGSRRSLVGALEIAVGAGREVEQRLVEHEANRVTLEVDPASTARWRTWLERNGLPMLAAAGKLTAPGRTRWNRSLRQHLGPLPDDPLELHQRAVDVLEALLTDTGKVRTLTHPSAIGTKASWRDARRYAAAKAALTALGERLADWPDRYAEARELPTPADRRLLDALVPFGRLAMEARRDLVETHASRGVLDFDRLQDAAVEAVTGDAALRATLRERHRWLMVDEFQDTDPRQWAMVRALGDQVGDEPADRVFLVGDVKQAIYGFRGGEVRLFHEAAEHLNAAPQELPDNFRSQPVLIDWFNAMFPRVLPADWSPIVAGREPSGGSVTWLEADTVQAQADAVVGLIVEALGSTRFGDLGAPSTPPVAILLRTRTNLALWERALQSANVPYQVGKGVGFWTRAEVVDVVNLLHAAITDDTLSWVGALRSPLLDAPEQHVHEHARGASSPAARARVEQLAELATTQPFGTWVRQLLTTLDAWSGWDAAGRANVRQLLTLIDAWDQPPLNTVERLLDRVERRPRETEAMLSDTPARVILLTVHAAKGLEFPVVVVPELHRRSSGRPAPLTVARVDGTWQVAATVDDVTAPVQTRATPSLLHRARVALREEATAESGRLLYVAVTRARDHLVFAGPLDCPAGTWGDLLRDPPSTTQHPTVESTTDVVPPDTTRIVHTRPAHPTVGRLPSVELVASDLADGESCTARWYRRSRLGLVDQAPDVDRQRAAIRGTVVHGLIEDRALDDPELARRRWRTLSADLPDSARTIGEREVLDHQRTCAGDAVLKAALDAPGFDELAVRIGFPGGVLKGRIDRLYIDRERGGFVVLDYKTAGREGPAHRLQLLVYGWAAATVLAGQEHGVPVVGGRLAFTETGVHHVSTFDAETLATVPGRLAALAALDSLEHAESVARRQPERPCQDCAFTCRIRVASAASDPPLPSPR